MLDYYISKMSSFKDLSLSERKEESNRIIEKYPERIPVIVLKGNGCNLPDLDKKKFLVPLDLNFGQFIFIIRKRIKLTPEKAIFIFINNTLPKATDTLGKLYKEQKNQDGFLYVTYNGENTFG